MIQSMRFNPDWNPYSGHQVCGLIELLYDIGQLSHNRNLTCVEIGSHNGESALLISSFPFIKTLYCIDIRTSKVLYTRLSHKILSNNIKIINSSSVEFANSIDNESIDMVYIDGNHSYESVLQDLTVWFPKIKNNGFITGHDYGPAHLGVVDAINKFIIEYNLSIYRTYMDSSFCILKRIVDEK